MVCGGFYLKFPCPMDAERAAEAVRDISDVTLQAMKNETGIHSNWSRVLVRDDTVLYADGETPMYAGEYAARETDTGANLYQKICMAIAQRWPEISFKGKCNFADTVSGSEHGIIAEYHDGLLRFRIQWVDTPNMCDVCRKRFDERITPVNGCMPEMPVGPHALRWKQLAVCAPTKACITAKCGVNSEQQFWELRNGHFVLISRTALHTY